MYFLCREQSPLYYGIFHIPTTRIFCKDDSRIQALMCRPTASTCALTMFMPVHIDSVDEMKVIINSALKDCKGFGKI